MSSTNKTTNYNLNQWIGSDIPKRVDFNSDNLIIDNALNTHFSNNDVHITANERTLWNAPFICGMYVGTGAATMDFNLNFQPKAVFVFAYDKPFSPYGNANSYGAVGTRNVTSIGLEVTQTGFKVYSGAANAVDGVTPMLNEAAMDYGYIAFK